MPALSVTSISCGLRRGRLFALRSAFGLLLLGIMAVNYVGHAGPTRPWYSPGTFSIGEMARFGQALFASIMAAQAAMVLGLTPALVADAIASERQRKTLHHLLASPLGSGEIVLGELAARLIGVGVYPALVLPIMSLLTLIGGVSPAGLVLGYAALASSAYFLGCLALLASVLARRPREAVGAAYSLAAAWLFLPPLLDVFVPLLPRRWPALAEAIRAVNAWVWPASPLGLVTNATAIFSGGVDELARLALWMVGSQVVYGTLLIALAVWQLRPAFRRHEGREGRQTGSARLARRWFAVRPCGDDPVFWKEAFFSGSVGGIGKKIVRAILISLLVVGVLATLTASQFAFGELKEHGYGYENARLYEQRMIAQCRCGGADHGLVHHGTGDLPVLEITAHLEGPVVDAGDPDRPPFLLRAPPSFGPRARRDLALVVRRDPRTLEWDSVSRAEGHFFVRHRLLLRRNGRVRRCGVLPDTTRSLAFRCRGRPPPPTAGW